MKVIEEKNINEGNEIDGATSLQWDVQRVQQKIV
jgi:hypothetical protein